MSIVKEFPDQNSNYLEGILKMFIKLILPFSILIFLIYLWNPFGFNSNLTDNTAKLDKQFVNPVTKKDERGEIVETTLSESFDASKIQIINPVSTTSSQLLEPQYPSDPVEATNTAKLFMAQNLSPKYSVDKYIVKFKSTDQKNESIIITSQIFIPKTTDVKKMPVYVFGQGTTGIGDVCAPSKEQPNKTNWANYNAHMLAYASQGYIVVFPDYEGFNDPNRVHHYFNSELESRVLLDASRAVYKLADQQILASQPAEAIFLAGFSQGGHAALSAKDFATKYAPKLPIKGVIAYAPATDVTALLKEAPALSPYLFYAYSDLYGKDEVDPTKYLQAKWLATLENDVNSICVDKIYSYYGKDPTKIYTPEFNDSLFNGKLEQDYPKLKEALDKNTTGFEESQIPIIVLQGATDPIVTAKTIKGVTKRLCDSGNTVVYKEYPNMDHFKIRQISFRDTLSFMQSVLNNQSPTSNCSSL